MKRFRNNKSAVAYKLIYDATNRCINENVNFSDILSNIEIKNSIRHLSESEMINISVNAIFDALGFNGMSNQATSLNESVIRNGKKVNIYNYIFEGVKMHKNNKQDLSKYVDEGIIAGAIGALAGISFGPAIGKAICDALGIGKGVLYDLLTSKLVNGAVCGKLGLRF
jgi:hypothetical protein